MSQSDDQLNFCCHTLQKEQLNSGWAGAICQLEIVSRTSTAAKNIIPGHGTLAENIDRALRSSPVERGIKSQSFFIVRFIHGGIVFQA